MKKIFYCCLGICSILNSFSVSGQEADPIPESKWNHAIDGWLYFMQDDFIFSPIYRADKDWLHLEARYNYEGINTFSGWFGYNFRGGNKFQYTITPMIGALVGDIHGISPGLELNFDFFGFNFNSATEYVFDLQGKENDFFYNWTDFTYTPLDWMWLGMSAQRTRHFHNNLEFQYGPMLGGGYKWLGLTAYWYNPASDHDYIVLYLSITL